MAAPVIVEQLCPLSRPSSDIFTEACNKFRLEKAKEWWNWIPHEKQRAFFLSPEDKVAACGRQSGKTNGGGADVATFAKVCGGTQIIIAPTIRQSDKLFNFAKRLLQAAPGSEDVKVLESPNKRIDIFKSGKIFGQIYALSTQNGGDFARGEGAHRVWADEAAYIPGTPMTEAIEPFLFSTGGQLIKTSTPFGKNHFYDSYRECRDNEGFAITWTSFDNPYINLERLEKWMKGKPQEAIDREVYAMFQDNVANVFPWEALQWDEYADRPGATSILSKETNTKSPIPGHTYVMGADPASWSDFGACCIIDVSEYPIQVVKWAHMQGLEWDDLAAKMAQLAMEWNCERVRFDTTHGSVGDVLKGMMRSVFKASNYKCGVVETEFTSKSKRDMVYKLSGLIRQRMVTIPYVSQLDKTAVDELRVYERQYSDGSMLEKFSAPEGRHDDLVTAFMLAVNGERPRGTAIQSSQLTPMQEHFHNLIETHHTTKHRKVICNYS